jgi:hypothetical protein
MTSTEQHTAVVSEMSSAIEKSVEIWKQGARSLTEQVDLSAYFPKIDLAAGFEQYFDLAQQTMDASRDITSKWVEAVASLITVMKDESETFTGILRDQAEKVSSLTAEQSEKVEKAVKTATQKAI